MKKRRGTPPRKRSTALVKAKTGALPAPQQRGLTADNWRLLLGDAKHLLGPALLTEQPMISTMFVGRLKLSSDQVAALKRPVADHEVSWRPARDGGPPVIPYLEHNGYRDRLDAAFGLGGWGIVQNGAFKRDGDSIYIPYALVIDGMPIAYTWGEQAQHKMSLGDAFEGSKSNAIVRLGKDLGIARELWSKNYVEALLKRVRPGTKDDARDQSAGYNAKADEVITEPQRNRLYALVKKAQRTPVEMSVWLKASYGLDDSRHITRRDYDAICKAVEASGPLPAPADE
jgi:hypothetical protein